MIPYPSTHYGNIKTKVYYLQKNRNKYERQYYSKLDIFTSLKENAKQ